MTLKRNNSGFTLLEIIIVIIIVGVLASLALPKLFSTIEYSRSSEALSAITSIRSSMERCKLMNANNYANCTVFGTELDMPDPGTNPGTHFTYVIYATDEDTYRITAGRNAVDGGSTADSIYIAQTSADIIRGGSGAFVRFK